jgi:hypothetical protein
MRMMMDGLRSWAGTRSESVLVRVVDVAITVTGSLALVATVLLLR